MQAIKLCLRNEARLPENQSRLQATLVTSQGSHHKSLTAFVRLSRTCNLPDRNAGERAPIMRRPDLLPIFVDPRNWEWTVKSRAVWEPAEKNWQDFGAKWYGATESQSASLAESQSLSLEPLPPRLNQDISSSIFVRESYVTMFDTIWAKAMTILEGYGVIITGQPGIGA